MSSNTNYITMWLQGPMQSYAGESQYDRIPTREFPTRSAVIGLLLASLGAGGEQTELLAHLNQFPMTVVGFLPVTSSGRRRETIDLVDYQPIGCGYDASDMWENHCIPKTKGGGPSSTRAFQTYRSYLQDKAFGVIFGIDEENAEALADAVQNPVWVQSLGRKNCVPSEPIYIGIFDTHQEGLAEIFALGEAKALEHSFTVSDDELDHTQLFGETNSEAYLRDDAWLTPVRMGRIIKYEERPIKILGNY